MNVKPLASGGSPGQTLGNISTSSVAPDKVERAKAIASGQDVSTLNIQPSDSYVDPQVAKAQDSIRRLKMRTNASPERYLDQAQAAEQASIEAQTGQDGTISDSPEQVNATTEDTKPLSPQFAALARQKRALQVKERELAERERAISSNQPKQGSDELVARLKSQPLSVLQEHGVTYDQLTEAILGQQGTNPDIQALKDEIRTLKEGLDKTLSDRDNQAEQQALAAMRRDAEALVSQGDAYEMVRETRSLPDVMRLIHQTYKSSGEVLEVSEALQLVEDELISESMKIANINKVKSRIVPPAQSQTQLQPQQRSGMKTLTNRDNARPTLDRKARAMQAFYGNKK